MVEGMRRVENHRAACCVAGVAQAIDEQERQVLLWLAAEAGVGSASLDALIERAMTHADFYEEQFGVAQADPKETMQLLFQLAIIDQVLGKKESAVLARLAERLNVPSEQFDRWLEQTIEYIRHRGETLKGDWVQLWLVLGNTLFLMDRVTFTLPRKSCKIKQCLADSK